MPPRGNGEPAKRGYVVRHKSSYRVQARIGNKTVRGPMRTTENEANSDLRHVQLLPNDQYISALTQLQRDRRQSVAMPAQSPSEPAFFVAESESSTNVVSPAPSSGAPPGLRQTGGRQSSGRGKVVPHKDGFRVKATIDKETVYGPCRSTEATSDRKVS